MSGNYSGWDHSAHCDLRKHIQKDETQATEGKHLDRFDFIVVMEETTVNVHLVLSTFITGYSLSVIITEDCAKGNRKTMYVLNNLISHKPWQQQVCPSRVQNSSACIFHWVVWICQVFIPHPLELTAAFQFCDVHFWCWVELHIREI